MQGMKLISKVAVLASLALSNPVFAEAPSETGKIKGDASKGQQIATQVCAACHNADGNSVIPANPRLFWARDESDIGNDKDDAKGGD